MYSFRSYFSGVCADTHREAYAHRMIGHGGYLPQYDRWNDQKKLEYYIKVEPDLTVNNEERIKAKQEQIDTEKSELKEKEFKIEELENNDQLKNEAISNLADQLTKLSKEVSLLKKHAKNSKKN